MVYVMVCDPCLDDDHAHCIEKDPDEHQARIARHQAGIVGGRSCICRVCNPKIKAEWYNEVKTQSEQVRSARAS